MGTLTPKPEHNEMNPYHENLSHVLLSTKPRILLKLVSLLSSWYNHFKNHLGNSPVVENKDEEIQPVFQELSIKGGQFTLKEYQADNGTLKAGKSYSDVVMIQEELKYMLIDDLLLCIAKHTLMDRELRH